jgi:predicted alpha/beta hydrolase
MTLGYFPGKRVGFGGTEARTVMRDWAQVARSGRYRPRGSALNYETALAQLRLPVLAISFEHDNFAPARAMKNLLSKMPAAAAEHRQLLARDTGKTLDHFNWVKHPEAVVPQIADWLALPAAGVQS